MASKRFARRGVVLRRPGRAPFSPRERRLLELVDALHDGAEVGDALWAALRADYSEAQLVALVALTGFYHLISFLANALRVPLEPYGARFPARAG